MSAHPLSGLLEPRGVALIGASQTPGKYGYLLLETLIKDGYAGGIFPINPKGGSLLGHDFLRSLDEATGPIDVALIVRPAEQVLPVVREVAELGIPFAIVYAAGFSEQGEDGRRLERAIVNAAAAHRTRVVGPNGMNIFSSPANLNLSAITPFPRGHLGLVSASGNLAFALAHEASSSANQGRVGFSRFMSVGNQADLALDDYVDYLRSDPHSRVVLVFLEGFAEGRGRRFLDAVSRTASEKPVIVLCGGRTGAGRETARSHTAALTTDPSVVRAALEQAGAVVVERADEVLSVAQAFADSPLPRGRRVALVGEGGGHATLMSDAAVEAGLSVEPLPPELVAKIRPHLPPFAALDRNPVELGGKSEYDLRAYEHVLGPVSRWPGCDQLILFGGYGLYDEELAAFLTRIRDETGKPVLLHDLYADSDLPGISEVRSRGLPLSSSPDVTMRVAGALARGTRASKRARRAAAPSPSEFASPLPASLTEALESARKRPERALSEDEAAALLAHFDIPVLPAKLARSVGEAATAAKRLGFPVVLKIHDASIVHKTEAGGVHLDLRNADEVTHAYESVRQSTGHRSIEVRLSPYVRGGVEAIVGGRRDPELGPLIVFGAGGVLAEVANDIAVRTIPCSDEELAEMITEAHVSRLLAGARGASRADSAAIVRALRSLARLILALSPVEEVEINPLRCGPEGVMALDARVLVGPLSTSRWGSRRD